MNAHLGIEFEKQIPDLNGLESFGIVAFDRVAQPSLVMNAPCCNMKQWE